MTWKKKPHAAEPSYPAPKGKKPRLEYQPPETLIVDERYQRSTASEGSQRLIRGILAAWDWNHFGVIIATDNGDGTYCVIDGQHRAEAARRHPGVRAVPVMVIDEMTLVEQAQAFAAINQARVSLNALQIHRAKVTAGDERARIIARLCAEAGLSVPNNIPTSGHIKPGMLICIATLYQILARHGEDALRRTLGIAASAYAKSAGDLRARIMQGVAVAIAGGADDAAIAARLATTDAEEWIYRAKKKGRSHSRQSGRAVDYRPTKGNHEMNIQCTESEISEITENEVKNAVKILLEPAKAAEETCGMPTAIAGLLCIAWSMAECLGATDDGMDTLSARMRRLARRIHGIDVTVN